MAALARHFDERGAKPAAETEPTMAQASFDTDICLRVMGRHSVQGGELAREAMVADSQLSRYLSGQFMLPLRVFAALWRLTRDPELLVLLATAETLVVPIRRADVPVAEASPPHPITPSRTHPIRPQPRPPFFAAHPAGVSA